MIRPATSSGFPSRLTGICGMIFVSSTSLGIAVTIFVPTPERYLAGNLALLQTPALVPDPPGPLVGVDAGADIHPTARVIAPCRIEAGAVVERGAEVGPEVLLSATGRVSAGVRIARAVVWPNATAASNVTNAVVTPDGVVGA